jgi:hypothetical protein
MARRSPMNERYQKWTGPKGQTRKSAAAAKPKKSNASGSSKSTSSKSSSTKSKSSSGSALAMRNPDTPEFRAARKQWWTFLIAGLVLIAVSWVLLAYVHTTWAHTASNVTLGLAYGSVFYALYIDWTKMRPMRKAAYSQAKSGKTPKNAKATAEKTTSEKVTPEKTTKQKVTLEDSED